MYSSLLGKHSAFEVEGFKGILSAVDRAFAYNPESKESVTFTVTREDQNFDVTNIEPLPPAAEDLPADTPMITAQKGVDVYESDNLWIKTLPSGRVEGEIRTAGKDMRFQGLADAQGNLIAALENGQTYRAHYTMDQEQFKIFSAHLVDA